MAAPALAVLLATTALVAVALWPGVRHPYPTTEARRRMSGLPPVILWAWERPENLDFIDTEETGVAFLARTIRLRGEEVTVRPRMQPLGVPAGARLIAVARIETDKMRAPALSSAQRDAVVSAVADLQHMRDVRAVQIDFDAVSTERAFYRELLFEVRRRLRAETALTITALSSWCIGDRWIDTLPVDEVVPMLFRMGADERQIHQFIETGADFPAPLCRTSYGLATDEAVPLRDVRARRFYFFNTRSWTPALLRKMLERYKRNEPSDS